jgi:hypothetical protein
MNTSGTESLCVYASTATKPTKLIRIKGGIMVVEGRIEWASWYLAHAAGRSKVDEEAHRATNVTEANSEAMRAAQLIFLERP